MANTHHTTDLVALADHHEQAFSAFLRMDALEHPLPPTLRWYHGLPWLMLPFGMVALAGILLSSLRTAPVFKDAAIGVVGLQLSIVEAVLAVIITEMFLVVARYVRILIAARNGKPLHDIDGLLGWGFGLAFGVAIFANLYANVGDLPILAPYKSVVDLLVGILVAISAPVLAFICGDVLAVLWLQSEKHRNTMREQFDLLMQEYLAARERRWTAQKSRYGVRIDISADRQTDRQPVLSGHVLSEQTDTRQTGYGYTRTADGRQKVVTYLNEHPKEIQLPLRTLAERIGVNKDTVSAGRRQWQETRES